MKNGKIVLLVGLVNVVALIAAIAGPEIYSSARSSWRHARNVQLAAAGRGCVSEPDRAYKVMVGPPAIWAQTQDIMIVGLRAGSPDDLPSGLLDRLRALSPANFPGLTVHDRAIAITAALGAFLDPSVDLHAAKGAAPRLMYHLFAFLQFDAKQVAENHAQNLLWLAVEKRTPGRSPARLAADTAIYAARSVEIAQMRAALARLEVWWKMPPAVTSPLSDTPQHRIDQAAAKVAEARREIDVDIWLDAALRPIIRPSHLKSLWLIAENVSADAAQFRMPEVLAEEARIKQMRASLAASAPLPESTVEFVELRR